MKFRWAVAVVATALAQLCLAQPAATWQLATGYRAESFHTQNIVRFAQDVEQATVGGLRIEVRPNNTLFKLGDIFQAVQQGQLESGETIMTSMVNQIPIAGADTVPFVVGSYRDAQRLWDLQRPLIEKQMMARGVKPLYAVPWPPQGLFSHAPFRSMTDFKGTRMRTYNHSTQRIAQLLGAKPVDVPTAEINQALANRKIDSMITSAVTGVENRVWSQMGYYYGIDAWLPKNIVFVSLKAFNALPLKMQLAVSEAATRAEKRGWSQSESIANESVQELLRQGMKVGRAPAEFEAELKRLGEKFSLEWVQSVGSDANLIFVPYYFQR